MLPNKHVYSVYDDIIHCEAQPPNLISASIYAQFGAITPNLKTTNISGYVVGGPTK